MVDEKYQHGLQYLRKQKLEHQLDMLAGGFAGGVVMLIFLIIVELLTK